jgi:hypothetical protein
MQAAFIFNRGIDPDFVARLNLEYNSGGWWRELASDRDLFIAVRNNYLNVYWGGASLLRISLQGENLIGDIHYKYIISPQSQLYVRVDDGKVVLPSDLAGLFQIDLSKLNELKRAAAAYLGDEKRGVHEIIKCNDNIIDTEIAFNGQRETEIEDRPSSRIDFCALRSVGDEAEINFYEAKKFTNKEIRARDEGDPLVITQIKRYQDVIAKHTSDLELSYRKVCGNLSVLLGVQNRYDHQLDLMRRIASGKTRLRVQDTVRLVIFGFDADQRDGKAWKPHRAKLSKALGDRLLLRGNANGFKRGISF